MTNKNKDFNDGLVDLQRNIGAGSDPRATVAYQKHRLDLHAMESAYRGWLERKIVDIPPDDITLAWRTFLGEDIEPTTISTLEDAENLANVRDVFNSAYKYARIYGGGAIYMVMHGRHGDVSDPLDRTKVQKGDLVNIIPLSRREIQGSDINRDITSPNFCMPNFYSIGGTSDTNSSKVHHTRVIRFEGLKLPIQDFKSNNYWHQSVIESVYDAVINANMTSNAGASIINRASLLLYAIDGLRDILSTEKSQKKLEERISLFQMAISNNNVAVIDKEEQLTNLEVNNITQLDALLERYYTLCSSAANLSVSRLVGTSAKGLNATGDGDRMNDEKSISAMRDAHIRMPLNQFDQVFVRSVLGEFPETLKSKFNPLFVETSKQIADRKTIEMDTILKGLDAGIQDEKSATDEARQLGVFDNFPEETPGESKAELKLREVLARGTPSA